MKVTKKFPKEELQLVVWDDSEKLTNIESKIEDTSRWSNHYGLIFQEVETGKFYETGYSVGATENQDEQPFEYDDDEIECNEVHQVEKTVLVWEAVNGQEN